MEIKGIEITSVTDKAIGLKLPVVTLEDLLNEHITLSDYGIGIRKIFIVFIAVPPTNTIHEEHVIYTEEERHLEIVTKLDYDEVLISNTEECMQMIRLYFFKTLEVCREYNISEFDLGKFLEKIQDVLK